MNAGGGRGGGGTPTELQLFGEPQGQQHHILNIIAARVERTLSISLSPSLYLFVSLSPKKKHQIYGVKFSRHAIYVRRICSDSFANRWPEKHTHTHAEIPLKALKKAKRSENRMRRWFVRGRQSRVWQVKYPVCYAYFQISKIPLK